MGQLRCCCSNVGRNVDIQNQNNDTKLQCCSVPTLKGSIDDAISICAQVESSVGLVMVRVKDKAEWVQWAMSPMGKGRKREVGKEGADGGCSFLGAMHARNINKTPANRWPRQTKYVKHANACQLEMLPVSPGCSGREDTLQGVALYHRRGARGGIAERVRKHTKRQQGH